MATEPTAAHFAVLAVRETWHAPRQHLLSTLSSASLPASDAPLVFAQPGGVHTVRRDDGANHDIWGANSCRGVDRVRRDGPAGATGALQAPPSAFRGAHGARCTSEARLRIFWVACPDVVVPSAFPAPSCSAAPAGVLLAPRGARDPVLRGLEKLPQELPAQAAGAEKEWVRRHYCGGGGGGGGGTAVRRRNDDTAHAADKRQSRRTIVAC